MSRTLHTLRSGALALATALPQLAAAQDAPPAAPGAAQVPAESQSPAPAPVPGAAGGFGGFGLPQRGGAAAGAVAASPTYLKYQYSFGSESDATYVRNADLDRQLRDTSLVVGPQVNGMFIYRPNDHVETLLEVLLEREYALQEEPLLTLPGGASQAAPRRHTSLVIDQMLVTFKQLGPASLTLGRRNYEDDRHWLYDTSLDTAFVRVKLGHFTTDVGLARKDWFDGDLAQKLPRGRITDTIVHTEYRGVEDHKFAAYAIKRDDKAGLEGDPLHLGVRAQGAPSDRFSYWAELGLVRGRDEAGQRLAGHAIDVGLLYRFPALPLHPSLLLGFASGSGDGDPADPVNRQFRQTGLQSNEFRAAGVSKFKYYGEAMDPELSNLRILTAGFGFRPATGVFVDVVWHKYTLHHIADEVRNWALTAQMNQDDTQLSRDAGQALDVVVGFRNLFGVRRLGLDVRAGWFFPGRAFRSETLVGPDAGTFRKADKGLRIVAKVWF